MASAAPANAWRPPRPLSARGSWPATWLVELLAWAIGKLSRASRTRLGRVLGWLVFRLGLRRRVTLQNLSWALPELTPSERRSIARGAYQTMAVAVLDAIASDHSFPIETSGWERVEQAQASGKGVLIATAHFGSWEMLGETFARRGLAVHAVVRPLKGSLNAKLVEGRRGAGLRLIHGRGSIGASLRALSSGGIVAMLIDQALDAPSAVEVPFFGRMAKTSPALSVCALRSGAPVLVALAVREPTRMRLFIEGPFPPDPAADRASAIVRHTAQVTQVIEAYVRRYPDQWLWLHRRWK